jgi:hypothetical protein
VKICRSEVTLNRVWGGVRTEDWINCAWRAIVSLDAVEMTGEEDPVEDLGHSVGGIGCTMDFEEFQDASFSPFLGGEILNIYVASPATRYVTRGHADSPFVVLVGGCGGGERKAKIFEELPEVFYDLSGIASGNNLRFGGGEGSSALGASACKKCHSAKHDNDAGDGARVAKDK